MESSILLPHLGRLRCQLGPDPVDDAWGHFRQAGVLEQLPYCIGGAAHAFFEFARLQNDIVARAPQIQKPGTVCVSEQERNLLGYSVDAFLDSATRTQNAVIPYLGKLVRQGLPSSFHDLAKKLRTQPALVPEPYGSLITKYWESHGARLRDYRDLAQHFSIVSSEARIYIPAEGSPGLCLLVPNNPEVKSVTKLKFDDPEIFAFALVREQFYALLCFCYELTWRMVDPNDRREVVYPFGSLQPFIVGRGAPKFYRVFSVEEVTHEHQGVLEKLGEMASAGETTAA